MRLFSPELVMTQLLSTVERYIPRTKRIDGTDPALKTKHMLVAANLVVTLSTSWLICRLLDLHDTNVDVKRLVSSCAQKLIRFLKHSTIPVGK